MRRTYLYLGTAFITVILLCGFACSPLQNNARNTGAALQGAIIAAQAQYGPTCTTNPSQASCAAINKAVAGENALVTAIESYCGWSPSNPPANPNAACVPVSSAQAALQTAIANANGFITQLKGAL